MSLTMSRRTALAATVGITSFAVLRHARAEDTVRIGVCAPLTGPAAEVGRIQINSLRLSADQVNAAGGILGRRVELVVEDDQTTNPGVVLAFSRLASDPAMVAFIGSIRSTQVNAMAPDVEKVGKPVMFGGTDPKLTHSGYRWLFRCRPNDSYSAQVIASFGLETLKLRKWALVHSTDTFGTGGKDALLGTLDKAGVQPVLVQGYANQQADFTPVVLAVKQSGADVMASYCTYEPDNAVMARQVRQLGVRIPWIGSPLPGTMAFRSCRGQVGLLGCGCRRKAVGALRRDIGVSGRAGETMRVNPNLMAGGLTPCRPSAARQRLPAPCGGKGIRLGSRS